MGVDEEQTNLSMWQIAELAREYCVFMQRESSFLDYMPSEQAAASLLLAINISKSSVAPIFNLEKISKPEINALIYNTLKIHAK